MVPLARQPEWPVHDEDPPEVPAPLRRARHAAPPKRKTVSADMVLDTLPMGVLRNGGPPTRGYTLHHPPATGLQTFDLGYVPASVTPPRSWRRAAWFAVGTSAAVVLGLAFAAVELMGKPISNSGLIDALPAYPSGPLTLQQLPGEHTTTPYTHHPTPTNQTSDTPDPESSAQESPPPMDTVADTSTGDSQSDTPSTSTGGSTSTETPTTPVSPTRRTVGPAPVTPTDPQAMGDRTEEYFTLVTEDPAAAHAMTTGDMAREGQQGIEARYAGVRRVEVQEITIDRNNAVTTSTVRIIRDDGTETVEHRQLTFTWGGNPKVLEDSTTV